MDNESLGIAFVGDWAVVFSGISGVCNQYSMNSKLFT